MTLLHPPELAPPRAPSPESLAGKLVSRLGGRADIVDLYGPDGSWFYHALSSVDRSETGELLRLVSRRAGSILELGAGSGRSTIPLLATGNHVTALDLSQSLLAILQERLDRGSAALRSRCTVEHADMSCFELHRTFEHVVLGTTTITLLDGDQQLAMFQSVRRHLTGTGRFYLSATRMTNQPLGRDSAVQIVVSPDQAFYFFEHYEPESDFREVAVVDSRFVAGDFNDDDQRATIAFSSPRIVDADQMLERAREAGFGLEQEHPLGTHFDDAFGTESLFELGVAR